MICDYKKLQQSGEPYPRTCPDCGLGSCRYQNQTVTTADELWDRLVAKLSPDRDANHVTMFKSDFIAVLAEYRQSITEEKK